MNGLSPVPGSYTPDSSYYCFCLCPIWLKRPEQYFSGRDRPNKSYNDSRTVSLQLALVQTCKIGTNATDVWTIVCSTLPTPIHVSAKEIVSMNRKLDRLTKTPRGEGKVTPLTPAFMQPYWECKCCNYLHIFTVQMRNLILCSTAVPILVGNHKKLLQDPNSPIQKCDHMTVHARN